MIFTTKRYDDILIIEFHGQGEYGDESKLKKQIVNQLNNLKLIAIDFSKLDMINSATVATIISLLRDVDDMLIEIAFVGANQKIQLVLERAFPKEYITTYSRDEFYSKYNINL